MIKKIQLALLIDGNTPDLYDENGKSHGLLIMGKHYNGQIKYIQECKHGVFTGITIHYTMNGNIDTSYYRRNNLKFGSYISKNITK